MTDVGSVKIKKSGSWVTAGFVKVKKAGVWETVWPLGVAISNQNISEGDPSSALARYRLNSDGSVYSITNNGGTVALEVWKLGGAAGDYEARATVNSGALTGIGNSATGSWLNLGTTRTWGCSTVSPPPPSSNTCNMTIEVRRASDGVVLDSASVVVTAALE